MPAIATEPTVEESLRLLKVWSLPHYCPGG